MRHVRAANASPFVTGTLRWWSTDSDPSAASEFDLTILHKTNVTLGSSSDCNLVIEYGVEDHHFTILAEKALEGTQIYLQPNAAVRKGYSVLQGKILLQHADQFTVGKLNFQYLSDSGE